MISTHIDKLFIYLENQPICVMILRVIRSSRHDIDIDRFIMQHELELFNHHLVISW